MRMLVSGATATIRSLLADPRYAERARQHLGHLVTPANRMDLDRLMETGLPIGHRVETRAAAEKGNTRVEVLWLNDAARPRQQTMWSDV